MYFLGALFFYLASFGHFTPGHNLNYDRGFENVPLYTSRWKTKTTNFWGYIRLYFLVIKDDYEPLVRVSLIVVEAWGGWIWHFTYFYFQRLCRRSTPKNFFKKRSPTFWMTRKQGLSIDLLSKYYIHTIGRKDCMES